MVLDTHWDLMMKTTRYLIFPITLIVMFVLNQFYPISLFFTAIVYLISATLQTYLMYKNMKNELKIDAQEYQYQIENVEKNRQLAESQLQIVFDNIPFPLAMLDTYGKLVLINVHFTDFLVDKKDIQLDYNSLNIDAGIRLFLNETYLKEKTLVKNILFDNRDYQCFSEPIFEQGRYEGCLLIFQDITLVAEKERMQKRFIADASHELRTPIASILGMIEILNREGFDDAETMLDFHGQIEKESNRLKMIVDDLLQLSRLSSGSVLINKKMCDLNQVVKNNIKEATKRNKNQTEILLTGQINEYVYVDEFKMHHVVNNLIENALMHSEATRIEVDLQLINKQIVLSVKDNGCGIEKHHLDYLFDRFYRVDAHRSRLSGGSGLGLSIINNIVIAHGGTIEVKSVVNEGTTFIVRLPL